MPPICARWAEQEPLLELKPQPVLGIARSLAPRIQNWNVRQYFHSPGFYSVVSRPQTDRHGCSGSAAPPGGTVVLLPLIPFSAAFLLWCGLWGNLRWPLLSAVGLLGPCCLCSCSTAVVGGSTRCPTQSLLRMVCCWWALCWRQLVCLRSVGSCCSVCRCWCCRLLFQLGSKPWTPNPLAGANQGGGYWG